MKNTIFKFATLKNLNEIICKIKKDKQNINFFISGKDESNKIYEINFEAYPIEEIKKFKISEANDFTKYITEGGTVYFNAGGLTETIFNFETKVIQYSLGKFILTMEFKTEFEEIIQLETTFDLS